jgi:hypothetical protein
MGERRRLWQRWLRFFEQNLCVDKWTSCPGLGSAGQLAS